MIWKYSFLIIFLATLAGCNGGGCFKNPLNNSLLNTGSNFTGTINVLALNGFNKVTNLPVFILNPDGSKITQTTGPTGQTSFQLVNPGAYQVGPANQNSNSPSSINTYLSVSSPVQNVTLQTGNIGLSVTAIDGKTGAYPFYSTNFAYNVTYLNSSVYQQDVSIIFDTTQLPTGWSIQGPGTGLVKPGQSFDVYIFTAENTQVPAFTLPVLAKTASGQTFCQSGISFNQNWWIHTKRNWFNANNDSFNCSCPPGGSQIFFRFNVAFYVTGFNLAQGAPDPATITFGSASVTNYGCLVVNPNNIGPWTNGLISSFTVNAASPGITFAPFDVWDFGACSTSGEWNMTLNWTLSYHGYSKNYTETHGYWGLGGQTGNQIFEN